MHWEGPQPFLGFFFPLFFPYLQCSELLWLIFFSQYQILCLNCHYHAVTLELNSLKPLAFLLDIRLSYLGSVFE